jgi:putative transposase
MTIAPSPRMLPKRVRLKRFDYLGRYRYFLTFCTHGRRKVFVSDEPVDIVWSQILRAGGECGFNQLAYVAMPDHLHLLTEGVDDAADLRRFAHRAKQRSAYAYCRSTGRHLWQPSYYDHVLRHDESSLPFIRYILENPVRAGLVEQCESYPYLGAGSTSVERMVEELKEANVDIWRPPGRRQHP